MLKQILILTIFLIPACVFSQVRFNKLLSDNNSTVMCSVIAEENGMYTILIGTYCGDDICFEIVKCDIVGNVIWRKPYGKQGEKWFEGWEGSFQKTDDGGYVLFGVSLTEGVYASDRPMIVKFDDQGDSLWSKRYSFDNAYAGGFNGVQTSDLGYAYTGIIYYFTDSTHTDHLPGDVLLIKTDSLGNMQWFNSYGGSSTDSGKKVVQTSDGGYLIGGTTLSFNTGWYPQDMYIVKTDSLGNFQWHQSYGNNSYGDPPVKDLIRTADGNYVFTGAYTLSYDSSTGFEEKEARIIKIDENGNTIWNKQYAIYDSREEPDDSTYTILYSVKELYDGSLACVGFYQRYFPPNAATYAKAKGILYKFNSEGDTLWTRRYYRDLPEGGYTGLLQVLDLTGDGGFILGGRVDYDYQNPYQKIWLIKTDSLGYDYPTAIEEVLTEQGIAVYPNPSAGEFNIRLKDISIPRNTQVEIFDMSGRKHTVNNSTHFGTFLQFDIYHLPAGIYFVRLVSDGEVVASVAITK